jgi:hypothetical protein
MPDTNLTPPMRDFIEVINISNLGLFIKPLPDDLAALQTLVPLGHRSGV